MARPFSLTIAGYGIETTPRLPVAVGQLEDGSLVFGPLPRTSSNVKNVLVKPGSPPSGAFERHPIGNIVTYSTGQRGSTQLVLGVDMATYEPVLEDFHAADHPAQWTIVTDDHSIKWPARTSLCAHGSLDGRSPYHLSRGDDKLITPVGPFTPEELPKPEQLVTPKHTFLRQIDLQGATELVEVLELACAHADGEWLERHYFVPTPTSMYLVTARAPLDAAAGVFEAADLVATSLRAVP